MYLRTTCTHTIQLTHARDYSKNWKKCTNQSIGEILNTPKWSTKLKELKFLNIQIAATEVAGEYITLLAALTVIYKNIQIAATEVVELLYTRMYNS
jgi:hypothetical protein